MLEKLENILIWLGFKKPVLQLVAEPKVLNSVTPVLQLPEEETIVPTVDLTPRFGRGNTPAIQHVDVCPYATTERIAEHARNRAIRGFTISE